MMSGAAIRELSRQAARKASQEHKYPTIIEQEDLDAAHAALDSCSRVQLDLPFIGDWTPRGYKATDNLYFVDSSGWGTRGERALVQREFLGNLRPGYAYAVVEAGQFQVYVQEYEVKTYTRRRN